MSKERLPFFLLVDAFEQLPNPNTERRDFYTVPLKTLLPPFASDSEAMSATIDTVRFERVKFANKYSRFYEWVLCE